MYLPIVFHFYHQDILPHSFATSVVLLHNTLLEGLLIYLCVPHIGVDAGSGLVHTITVTAANVHDVTQTEHLLREDDEVVYGDSGYIGVQKRPEIANNEHFSKIDFRINRRPGKLPPVFDNTIDWERYIENRKSSVRCKVEHAFRIIKCQFGYKKTVYKGL